MAPPRGSRGEESGEGRLRRPDCRRDHLRGMNLDEVGRGRGGDVSSESGLAAAGRAV